MDRPRESTQDGPGTGTRTRAVIVAAGSSRRMAGAGGARKPLLEVGGRAVIERACAAFDAVAQVIAIVVLAHPDDLAVIRELVSSSPCCSKVRAVVEGGAERCDSVRIGCTLELAGDEPDLLCVHDAARPFVLPSEIVRVLTRAAESGAALLAAPVRDTVKHSRDGDFAERTVDRSRLWTAQTPQAFERERFLACLAAAEREGWTPTDDSGLWERAVGPVALVTARAPNPKITVPEDLLLARALAASEGLEA